MATGVAARDPRALAGGVGRPRRARRPRGAPPAAARADHPVRSRRDFGRGLRRLPAPGRVRPLLRPAAEFLVGVDGLAQRGSGARRLSRPVPRSAAAPGARAPGARAQRPSRARVPRPGRSGAGDRLLSAPARPPRGLGGGAAGADLPQLPERFVAIAPGAVYGPAKAWPAERYRELARELRDRAGRAGAWCSARARSTRSPSRFAAGRRGSSTGAARPTCRGSSRFSPARRCS